MDKITRKFSLVLLGLLIFAPFSRAVSQKTEGDSRVLIMPRISKHKIERKNVGLPSGDDTFSEKSIAVDQKVNIYLCVAEGNLKVNGWERNEIRAFVSNGSDVGFRVQQKNKQENPVLLTVIALGVENNADSNAQICLSGDVIELDVPRGAVINVKGRTSETMIDSVRKVIVKNIGGDITLSGIEQGINASTYQGDVTVENSTGAINLETTNGNVLAYDVAPGEIGDIFKAKSISGAISLEKIGHRQNEITSNSGSVNFVGEIQSGGQYDFRTQNGAISLAIPETSSCKINASYGFGAFNTEFKLDNLVKSSLSRTQSLTARIGSGDASVNLTTYSGSIRLKKQ